MAMCDGSVRDFRDGFDKTIYVLRRPADPRRR